MSIMVLIHKNANLVHVISGFQLRVCTTSSGSVFHVCHFASSGSRFDVGNLFLGNSTPGLTGCFKNGMDPRQESSLNGPRQLGTAWLAPPWQQLTTPRSNLVCYPCNLPRRGGSQSRLMRHARLHCSRMRHRLPMTEYSRRACGERSPVY